ncbi:MAG TPA: hypothetical protein VMW65_10665, partial [Chloroflexota bacterium]|nr:hypothetical protein [Chloroflexota bacterium]
SDQARRSLAERAGNASAISNNRRTSGTFTVASGPETDFVLVESRLSLGFLDTLFHGVACRRNQRPAVAT